MAIKMKRGPITAQIWGDEGRGTNAPHPYSIGHDPSRMASPHERVYDSAPGKCRSLTAAEIRDWEREHADLIPKGKRNPVDAALYLGSSRGRGGKPTRWGRDPKKTTTEKKSPGFKFTTR